MYLILTSSSVLLQYNVVCRSDNLIPELPNTAYNCGQHRPFTVWFSSVRPGNVVPYNTLLSNNAKNI